MSTLSVGYNGHSFHDIYENRKQRAGTIRRKEHSVSALQAAYIASVEENHFNFLFGKWYIRKLSEHHKEAQALLKVAIIRSETIFLTVKQTILGHPQ